MNLNINNIKELIESEKITCEDIFEILDDNASVKRARDENVGMRFGSWDEVCNLLDAYTQRKNLNCAMGIKSDNLMFVVNLSYFLPTLFSQYIDGLFKIILNLNYSQLCVVFSREQNVISIIRYLDGLSEQNSITFPPKMTSLLVLSAKAHNCYKNSYEEIFLLSKLMKYTSAEDITYLKNFLLQRVTSLVHEKSETVQKKISQKKRIALMINGQFRSLDNEHLKKISFFLSNYDVDVYVSTWLKKGGNNIKVDQLHRHFDRESVQYLQTLSLDMLNEVVNKFIEHRKADLNDITEKELNDTFIWANHIHANIEDESKECFLSLNNEEKMYFHNNYWVEKYGESHFEKYDYILKTRTDIEFTSLNLSKLFLDLSEFNFVTEDNNGWIFRTWGFGVGDQVLIGLTKVMLDLLTIYKNKRYNYLMKQILGISQLRGHINLGIEAFLNNYECLSNKYFNLKFIELSKININQVKNIVK